MGALSHIYAASELFLSSALAICADQGELRVVTYLRLKMIKWENLYQLIASYILSYCWLQTVLRAV